MAGVLRVLLLGDDTTSGGIRRYRGADSDGDNDGAAIRDDVDARTGKHGAYYDGYLLDVSMDADSELICVVEVLPANGDEAANAKALITREEAAQGNDIASLSIDRIGYRGDVLAALSDEAEGPQLTV